MGPHLTRLTTPGPDHLTQDQRNSKDTMRLQKTVVVDKPLDAVFDYLADFTTTTEWDPGTVVTVNHHGDGGVGTTYLNTSTFLGRETQLTYVVREFVPGERIRLRGENKTVIAVDTMTLPQHRCRHRGDLHSRVHPQRPVPSPRPAAQARLRTARHNKRRPACAKR